MVFRLDRIISNPSSPAQNCRDMSAFLRFEVRAAFKEDDWLIDADYNVRFHFKPNAFKLAEDLTKKYSVPFIVVERDMNDGK